MYLFGFQLAFEHEKWVFLHFEELMSPVVVISFAHMLAL